MSDTHNNKFEYEKKIMENILHEFQEDELTGLYTRQAFFYHAGEVIKSNPEKRYGIVAMDDDNFKLANSNYGEEKCNEFLSYLGMELKRRIPHDVIGRFGGDQFVWLVEIPNGNELSFLVHIDDSMLIKSPIPGLVLKRGLYYPIDRRLPIIRCCDRAFMAIRKIKGVYGENFAIYSEDIEQHMLEDQKIQECMVDALENKEFTVYYQPKHDSMSGKIVGAEALVRWIHPVYGYMSPARFIPLFERNGFITKLDEYVINKVCEDVLSIQSEGKAVVPISINISRRDYLEDGWIEKQMNSVLSSGIDTSLIHFEVTESLYTEHTEIIIEKTQYMQSKGFLIEMDDFGSGYSSLGMLAKFPLDVLKLDISFVQAIDVNEVVVESIINLAHRMGLKTIAEGVETQKQFNILRGLGCDFIQGFFFSKAIPKEEFVGYISEHSMQDADISAEEFEVKKWSEITGELEIKNALLECIDTMVIQRDGIEPMEKLLSIIGRFYGADRAYLYETGKNSNSEDIIYEWCANGMESNKTLLKMHFKLEELTLFNMLGNDFLYVENVDGIEEERPMLYQFLKSKNMDNLMVKGIKDGDKFIGIIAVEKPTVHTDSMQLVNSISPFVLNEYERKNYIEELKDAGYRDFMTGINNRRAFYDDSTSIETDPYKNSVPIGIAFADVNGLKRINDELGHEKGDEVLLKVVENAKEIFVDSKIYRFGGDEFVILVYDVLEKAFIERVERFKDSCNDVVAVAVGYVWNDNSREIQKSVALADRKMYIEKNKYYEKSINNRRKTVRSSDNDMGRFALDVANYVPGGFFVYKADETEEILFFNNEVIDMYGCDSIEEFKEHVHGSFKGMVHPDDLDKIEKDIDSQIDEENDLDYVEYRIIRKDGSIREVRDYGRFVHTEEFGNVYHVFITFKKK